MKELSKELDRLHLLVGPQTSEEEYSGNLSIRTDVSDKSFDSSKDKDKDKDRDSHAEAKTSIEIASSSKNQTDQTILIFELSQEIERLKLTCQSQAHMISELSARSFPTGSQCYIQFLPNNQSDQVLTSINFTH